MYSCLMQSSTVATRTEHTARCCCSWGHKLLDRMSRCLNYHSSKQITGPSDLKRGQALFSVTCNHGQESLASCLKEMQAVIYPQIAAKSHFAGPSTAQNLYYPLC